MGNIFENIDHNMKMGLRKEVAGTGSGFCQMVGCGFFFDVWVVLPDRWSVRWNLGEWVVRIGRW
jgi:hypothetical protein